MNMFIWNRFSRGKKKVPHLQNHQERRKQGKNGFEMTALSKYSGVLPSKEEIHIQRAGVMAVRQINIHSLTLLQAHCPFSRLHAQRQPDLCRGRAGGHHFGLCIRPRCSKLYTSSEVKQSHVLPSSLFSSPQPASGQQITGLSNITGRTKKMCHLIGKLSTVHPQCLLLLPASPLTSFGH